VSFGIVGGGSAGLWGLFSYAVLHLMGMSQATMYACSARLLDKSIPFKPIYKHLDAVLYFN